jgi:hypothetical protein
MSTRLGLSPMLDNRFSSTDLMDAEASPILVGKYAGTLEALRVARPGAVVS